jgi:asparagine synthase (glutamine-hydrolysing)
MCRVFGEFSFSGQLSPMSRFKYINAFSKVGGPDATDFWEGEHCRFGFNRLAILDVSERGNQPVVSPNGRFVMVFNGEVYNFKALQTKYNISNSSLRSSADTEVLVHLLEILSIEEFAKALDGMFGIAVWDKKLKTLHLVRDFAGIKPLHYGINDRGVVFASQFNQVARHDWFCDEKVNPEVLALYLKRHYVPSPYGLYNHTFQVMPGELISIQQTGETRRYRYWELPRYHESTIFSANEALEYIDQELERAVKSQLISDVPLGAFLSGGIDSPLVCKYAERHSVEALKTFTIGSDSKRHDESLLASNYLSFLNAEARVEMMDSHYAAGILDEVMGALGEPFADFSIIPTYLVSKLASSSVKVALSGDGGDELFFGYERFWSVAKNRIFQKWPDTLKYGIYGIDKVLSGGRYVNSGVLLPSQGLAHQGLHSRTWKGQLNTILGTELNPLADVYPEYDYDGSSDEASLLQQMRYSEFYDMMQKTLRKTDAASMGNSLEVRVPFLQKSFIEASLKVDYSLSYGKNKRKELLRHLLKKHYSGIVLDDKKRGFTIPLGKWIKEDLRTRFEEVLLDKTMCDYFGFSRQGVMSILNEHNKEGKDNKWILFTIFSLFKWQENLKK